jgi:hypothetical protein
MKVNTPSQLEFIINVCKRGDDSIDFWGFVFGEAWFLSIRSHVSLRVAASWRSANSENLRSLLAQIRAVLVGAVGPSIE